MSFTAATKFWLALLLVGALLFVVYWPGVYGGFLFDDFATLPYLGHFGPVDNWTTFWRYITSGGGDPTGRPVAMLSFLIDAHNWPADPFPFKCTNLALHWINGILLIVLLRWLGYEAFRGTSATRIDLAAVIGGAYWLLQPLLVSTTLYIVQRETLLSASFVLLGLLSWLHGRRLLLSGQHFYGRFWTVSGLGICTTLAALSKANGLLLPVLAFVIEYVFLRTYAPLPSTTNSSALYRKVLLTLVWIPATIILVYLAYKGWSGITRGISSIRPWTLWQRLITEPRVLMSYLQQLWLPRPFTTGLFNDELRASTSVWSPETTLPSLLALSMLIFGACWFRRRWPAVALAILFYFGGHLLESSTIPLELYFEHRNYVPAMMMYWPLALWLCDVPIGATQTIFSAASRGNPQAATSSTLQRSGKSIFAIALLLGLAMMTHANAGLWGNARDQAILWAKLNPASPRAQANAAIVEINLGHPELAAIRLRSALTNSPNEVQLSLNLLTAECQLGRIDQDTMIAARTSLRMTQDTGPLLLNWFDAGIAQIQHPPCQELSTQALDVLLDAALANPRLMAIYGRRQDLYYLQGRLALVQDDANLALRYFDLALDQQINAQTALNQAALLGAAGFPKQGLVHLDYYESKSHLAAQATFGMPQLHAWLLQREQYWPNEVTQLRASLSADAYHQSRSSDDSTRLPK